VRGNHQDYGKPKSARELRDGAEFLPPGAIFYMQPPRLLHGHIIMRDLDGNQKERYGIFCHAAEITLDS
jgi:hypothetical protein